MTKRKPKRSSAKHPSLVKRFNSRIRQEYIDMDYIDELDDTKANCQLPDGTMVTEKEWMAQFMKEWNNASVPSQKRAKDAKVLRTKEEIKESTDQNNRRNNDVYGVAKAQNMIHKEDYEVLASWIEEKEPISNNYTEAAVIELLDQAQELSKTTQDTDEES